MPVVTFDYNDFIGLLKYKIPKEELIEKLPMIGADLDRVEDDKISIEFFPNRPDLASVEGIARAARSFFGFETGLKTYNVKKSNFVLNIDQSVKTVRPFVAAALVRNVTMTDELITSLMDLQEKLHFGLGRNRRKVAIGVHNFESVKPPFTYKAVTPNSIEFVPLAKVESMTLDEILTKHEKGIAYAHLLEEFNEYPLIVDSEDNVLSFPPIINGSLTEITPFTEDIFIDVTGTHEDAVNHALNIVVTALAERKGKIFSVTVKDNNKSYVSPDLTPALETLSVDYVNKMLGTKMSVTNVTQCLIKMGYNVEKKNKDKLMVKIPAWRSDILHQIDLVEDVAIGYGFDKFKTERLTSFTFGKTLARQDLYDALRNTMIGLGFNEVVTLAISNEQNEFTNLGLEKSARVEIENPLSKEYSCLRVCLLSSLLRILSENRHHSLPQQVFELGTIMDENAKNCRHLAGLKIDAKASFTECKSLVESLLREINISWHIINKDHPAFVDGRCASIIQKGKEVGFFGELHPKTITTFELEYPVIAFEVNVDTLKI
ncbi:phenylalanyl-tRNA synthetase beta subunit [Thermoplasmatales archaeon SCGC AB-539-N05]|nr:phenylalanyl-tRNA synthetase beta subunit [Thermoplasmatales archaeon SCGC AB-539-N05]